MAILPVNSVLNGTSGILGDLVFKNRNGKTFVSARPQCKERIATGGQTQVQEQFLRCVKYAKEVIRNPAIKNLYMAAAQKGKSAYNIAFADAFKAPEIRCIDVSRYKGRKNNVILVTAKDDFKVVNVLVSIYSAKGKLIEQGNAVLEYDLEWKYTVNKSTKAYIGSSITATAIDLPGNETSLTVQVPSPGN